MNRKLYLVATCIGIVLVVFAFSSCRTVKNSTNNELRKQDKKDSLAIIPIVKDTGNMYVQSDSYTLIGAELKGSILEIEVEYGGGCGGDVWTLAWTGMLMKSMPPKANIYLHLKDEDPCRALVRKKISFDISTVYHGEVFLLLKEYSGVLDYKP